jgi:VanZ family protein
MLPLAHARAWLVASLLLVVAVLYASLAPLNLPENLPSHFDKVEHAFAYMFLAVWFAGLVVRAHYWKIVLALAALGLVIEILQHVMAFGRYGDPMDMAANLLGVGLGIALASRRLGGWALKVEAWLNRS